MSSYAHRAAQSGLWFAGTKFSIQILSWATTIIVARTLVPEDYGLSAMASFLTGYLEIFSELGLGAAIVQRREVSPQELSSTFWLSLIIGSTLSVVAFCLAYPTAWIFHEPRVIPVTQVISILFVISSLSIVPYSVLSRNIRFKEIGLTQFAAVGIASVSMIPMARANFGVWTLICGVIIQRTTSTLFLYLLSGWRPLRHFQLSEARPLIMYGVNVAGSRSLFYLFQKADKFIVGKFYQAAALGYYSFAQQLAATPTEKIVSVINQVSFPVFSRYQDDQERIRELFLSTMHYITLIVAPIFIGGAIFGREIIVGLLGAKWEPIVFLFRMFCVAQLVESLTTVNGVVHAAQGRPIWGLYFTFFNILVIPVALVGVAARGLDWLALPWVTLYPLLALFWTTVTLRKLGIGWRDYQAKIVRPLAAALIIICAMRAGMTALVAARVLPPGTVSAAAAVAGCALLYLGYLARFERQSLAGIMELRKK